jgi:hypothetical protein
LLSSLALCAVVASAFACSSDDSSSGKTATGGGGTSSGGGGSGGVAQGGMAGLPSGGSAGLGSGGFAGVSSGGSAGAVNWGPYPSGPYGHDVGSTIADLHWEGYVNETGVEQSDQVPFVDYGTDAMRTSGKSYGLIHVSAFT